jgi:hypothetical protein
MSDILHRAIKSINADAVYVSAGTLDEIKWLENTTPISVSDLEAKILEIETADNNKKTAQADLKASAKAKLIAGEALTEDEANTIVL